MQITTYEHDAIQAATALMVKEEITFLTADISFKKIPNLSLCLLN